ncbi:MAG: DUF5721 family protein [Eubacteriales bacterium]|nr:DUF5721 family protein [Eubacteriales bacterium]
MLALKISDIRDFTNKLFIQETFDAFWLCQARISTYSLFSIDGRLDREFFDSDELELLDRTKRTHALWKEVKPHCFSIIRGKRAPRSFRIVFQLSSQKTTAAIKAAGFGVDVQTIHGLFLNLSYKNKMLLCTTGVSLDAFLPGKELEQLWDSMILDFFRQNQILFEQQ